MYKSPVDSEMKTWLSTYLKDKWRKFFLFQIILIQYAPNLISRLTQYEFSMVRKKVKVLTKCTELIRNAVALISTSYSELPSPDTRKHWEKEHKKESIG